MSAIPCLLLSSVLIGAASQQPRPLVFKDTATGILFYVETDRQHVSAIDKEGKLLWSKSIVQEAKIRPAKKGQVPTVLYIGKSQDWMVRLMKKRGKTGDYIGISFSTSESGVVDQRSGEYTFMGND